MTWGLLLLATLFVAYANGANDNFKGVATLFGSRAVSYDTALRLATVATIAGSIASVFVATALVKTFSGRGLVPDMVAGSTPFLLAVAVGSGCTVILATVLAFPVSTTHSLTGALLGAGAIAAGASLNLDALGSSFILPLLLSPVLAVASTVVLYAVLHRWRMLLVLTTESSVVALTARASTYAGALSGVPVQRLLFAAHVFSAATVSFARGLNDTPKIAGLLLVVQGLDLRFGLLAVAVAMACGGLLNARKVAQTMSMNIARMNDGQAFAANAVTGLLVILASRFGLPVSTTHVSVGAIAGVGLINGSANTAVLRGVLLSWVLTLPVAALTSALAYLVIVGMTG